MTEPKAHPWAQSAAVLGGIGMTAQSRVNGELASTLGNGWQAATISFSTGLICVLGLLATWPRLRQGMKTAVNALRNRQLHWWQTTGGVVGALFVAVQSSAVPRIGVALFTVTIIGAQTGASLTVDRLGIGPQGIIKPTKMRLVAASLALVAVLVALSDRFEVPGFAWWAIGFAFVVGVAVTFQHAINGLVSRASGNPLVASVFNFTWGTLLLFAGLLLGLASGWWSWQALPTSPWWIYSGGLLGLAFITISAAVLPILGSLRYVLGAVAGQLLGALLLDWLVPTRGSAVTSQLLFGVALTALAVGLANLRPAVRR